MSFALVILLPVLTVADVFLHGKWFFFHLKRNVFYKSKTIELGQHSFLFIQYIFQWRSSYSRLNCTHFQNSGNLFHIRQQTTLFLSDVPTMSSKLPKRLLIQSSCSQCIFSYEQPGGKNTLNLSLLQTQTRFIFSLWMHCVAYTMWL